VPLDVSGSKSLYWKTGIDTTGLKTGSMKAKGILASLSQNVTKMDVFAGLGLSATLAFAKVGKEAYNFSKKYETAMKEVQTISDAVKANYKGVSDEIINLSTKVPDAADKLAKAYYQIVSAGYDGAEAMKMLEQSAKLATAGVTDTFVSADAITSIMNAYGAAAGNAENISDKLFKTVELGKTKMEELGPTIGTVTGLSAQAGLAFDELMAIIAKGVKTMPTDIMMTGIKGMLNSIIKGPTKEAAELIENLGLEFDIASMRSKGFNQFMTDLMEKTGGNIETLQKLFPNVRGLAGLLAVATEAGGEFKDILDEIQNSTGATEEAFRIMMESTDNQIAILRNNITAKLKPLGDAILGQVNEIAGALNRGFANAVKEATKASALERMEFEKNVVTLQTLLDKTDKTKVEKEYLAKAIKTLQDQYPDYLGNIDAETTKYEDLKTAIEEARQSLHDKIVLQMSEAEISVLTQKKIELELRERELIEKKNEALANSKIIIEDLKVDLEAARSRWEEMIGGGVKWSELTEEQKRRTGLLLEDQVELLAAQKKIEVASQKVTENQEEQNELQEEINQVSEKYNNILKGITENLDGHNNELDETKEKVAGIAEIGEAFKNAISEIDFKLPELGNFELPEYDFSSATKSLSELMTIFGNHTKQLEDLRQAGIDTTDLLDKEWKVFTDNIKQYYGEESATYLAALNLKKDADREYLEWRRAKWEDENRFWNNILDTSLNSYKAFANSLIDMDMTGKERKEMIWEQTKSSFVSMLVNMTAEAVKQMIVQKAISASSQAASVATATATGLSIASAYSGAAALASLASFGANAVPASAGMIETVALGKMLAKMQFNKGGEVDWKEITQLSQGGELQSGSDMNMDSVLTILTKKEIVNNRESSQHKNPGSWEDNRDFLLNLNKNKYHLVENYIPKSEIWENIKNLAKMNSGGEVWDSIKIPDIKVPYAGLPNYERLFPKTMNVTSGQLDRKLTDLIKAVKAQTINQMSRDVSPQIVIKSDLDMESFVIEMDKTKNRMKHRGYIGE
jgi:TP901 family phage tail tape measure protein